MDPFHVQVLSNLYDTATPQQQFLVAAEGFIEKAILDVNSGQVSLALKNFVSGLQLYFLVLDREVEENKTLILGAYVEQLLNFLECLKALNHPQVILRLDEIALFYLHPTGERSLLGSTGHIERCPVSNHLILKVATHQVVFDHSTSCVAMGNSQYLLEVAGGSSFALQLSSLVETEFEKHFGETPGFKRMVYQAELVKPTSIDVNEVEDWEDDFVMVHHSEQLSDETPLPGSIFQTGVQDYHLNFMASGVETVASKVAEGISFGAQALQKGILGTGEALKSSIEPNAEETEVNPLVGSTLFYLKQITSTSVKVTGAVVDKLTELSIDFGAAVGNRVLDGMSSSSESGPKDPRVKALKNLAKSGLEAIGTVMGSIGDAGDAVFDAAAESTIAVVGHKYGEEVGIVTQDAFDAGKDVLNLASNVQAFAKPKALAKALAKDAAKETAKTVFLGPQKEKVQTIEHYSPNPTEIEQELDDFVHLGFEHSVLVESDHQIPVQILHTSLTHSSFFVESDHQIPVQISDSASLAQSITLPESTLPVPPYTPSHSYVHLFPSPPSQPHISLLSSFPSVPQYTPGKFSS